MSRFLSLTDRRIATTKGHVLVFKAREPKEVPAEIELELLGLGLAAVDELTDETPPPEPTVDETSSEPEFDQAVFEAAIREVIAKNDPSDLTDKNNPKVKAVTAITGFPVTGIHIANYMKSLED